jgi:hypothetical protein
MNPRTNEYHADDGMYECPKCKLATHITVKATCDRVLALNDDGVMLGWATYNESYDQTCDAECNNPKCGYKGKLREFLIGYVDGYHMDACPDCEHVMAIMPDHIGADGKPIDDADVFCHECEGQLHKLADWKAKGWRCLEAVVVFYKSTRKSCPSCGAPDHVDVTGKARDGYMLCRCGDCAHWWAEPEDGHPSYNF